MSWDWDEYRGFYYSEDSLYPGSFDSDVECPECGSYNTIVEKVLEETDRDGNRGRFVNYIKCYNCGYEE